MIGIDDILLTVAPDALRGMAKAIPNAINKARFKNFFGRESLTSENVYAVLDPYEHPVLRPQLQRGQARFLKRFHGRRNDIPIIGEDKLLGRCSIRVTKYSSETFSQFRRKDKRLKVVLDEDVMNSWDGSFLCFGSSDSNIKSFDIEGLPQNNLYRFDFDPATGYRCFIVNGQRFTFGNRLDKAVLARFSNPHHPEHSLFICAGLGEWGTSGSAYFLFDRWKELSSRYKRGKNFCLIIEVDVGSDESAREVFAYSP